MEKKSSKYTRRLEGTTEVANSDAGRIKRLLGL
jgi:large subunit ribosomal protein L35